MKKVFDLNKAYEGKVVVVRYESGRGDVMVVEIALKNAMRFAKVFLDDAERIFGMRRYMKTSEVKRFAKLVVDTKRAIWEDWKKMGVLRVVKVVDGEGMGGKDRVVMWMKAERKEDVMRKVVVRKVFMEKVGDVYVVSVEDRNGKKVYMRCEERMYMEGVKRLCKEVRKIEVVEEKKEVVKEEVVEEKKEVVKEEVVGEKERELIRKMKEEIKKLSKMKGRKRDIRKLENCIYELRKRIVKKDKEMLKKGGGRKVEEIVEERKREVAEEVKEMIRSVSVDRGLKEVRKIRRKIG